MIIPGLPLVVPKKSYSPVEGFETYPLNSSPSKFLWQYYETGYYDISNIDPIIGKQCLRLVALTNEDEIGCIFNALNNTNLLITKFKIKYTYEDGWCIFGISGKNITTPDINWSCYFWILGDGTVTADFSETITVLMIDVWYDIIITTNLIDNEVIININNITKQYVLSDVWGSGEHLAGSFKINSAGQGIIYLDQISLQTS